MHPKEKKQSAPCLTDKQGIAIKGQRPRLGYKLSLRQVFNSYQNQEFTEEECLSLLQTHGIHGEKDTILHHLFHYRLKYGNLHLTPSHAKNTSLSFAGPFQMKSALNRFQYNLDYQDAVIKIELEKNLTDTANTISKLDGSLKRILNIISIVLRTKFFLQEPLYLGLTNSELDSIVLKCLSLSGITTQPNQQSKTLLTVGIEANNLALLVLDRILSKKTETIDSILPFVIYSGIIWWSDEKNQREFKNSPDDALLRLENEWKRKTSNKLGINDFLPFQTEVIYAATPKQVLWFLDDNGELVWNLFLIQLLLDANPRLTITCIVNGQTVTNNANIATLFHCLEHHHARFNLLDNARFRILEESNELPAIDLRFASPGLREKLFKADIILVNGVSFFEKLQYLPATTYYMFTVYSETSQALTGFQRYDGIFARIGPHLCCFSHIETNGARIAPKMNLKKIHNALQTPAYSKFQEQFSSEGNANLSLLLKAFREGNTLETLIRKMSFGT